MSGIQSVHRDGSAYSLFPELRDQAQAAEVVTAAVDDSKPIKEKEETSKGIEELLEDGAHCLALGKFSESVEHYAFAVEKL